MLYFNKYFKNFFLMVLAIIVLGLCFFAGNMVVLASDSQSEKEGLEKAGTGFYKIWAKADPSTTNKASNLNSTPHLFTAIGSIVSTLSAFLSIAFIVIIIVSGYYLIFAGENQERVKTAKGWLRNGIIGLVIMIAAFMISETVVYFAQQAIKGATEDKSSFLFLNYINLLV
jgi:hypothetical protein